MHDHHSHSASPSVQRHCDVAVIGGSAAGLAGALQLVRQRRSVIVIDSDEPRNATASHMHSYLGHEGLPASELRAIGREEVRSFGGEVLAGRAIDVTRSRHDNDGFKFVVHLAGGTEVLARRVLAATGVTDVLPDIEGLADHWGSGVITCPFCHGYEVRDARVVQIVTHPIGLHPAVLFAHLSSRLTLVLHDGVAPDDPALGKLRASGVDIIDTKVKRVVASAMGDLEGVELADGTAIGADAVVVTTIARPRIDALQGLGIRTVPHPSGVMHQVEATPTGETEVAGLFAAGNIVEPSLQMLPAAAGGSQVGAMIGFSLADDDLSGETRSSANQTDWDHRYSGERMWSGNPNGSLVAEVGDIAVGSALDVGAGEGGDAVWLAEQGWQVTANDISQNALDRIDQVAVDRGVRIETLRADMNQVDPFRGGTFDLVSAQYASIPRSADNRGIENLLETVAEGGTLIVVGHDLEPMRAPIDVNETSRAFDPDAYIRVSDVAEALDGSTDWEVLTYEKRPRPAGATSSHHVDDVVLKARRR